MKYKAFLKKYIGHILCVSLLGNFTFLVMVYAGYSHSSFIVEKSKSFDFPTMPMTTEAFSFLYKKF